MNGPMFAMLTVCGVWFILRNVEVEVGLKEQLKFLAKAIGLYFLIFICLVVLYIEVVLRWLVF